MVVSVDAAQGELELGAGVGRVVQRGHAAFPLGDVAALGGEGRIGLHLPGNPLHGIIAAKQVAQAAAHLEDVLEGEQAVARVVGGYDGREHRLAADVERGVARPVLVHDASVGLKLSSQAVLRLVVPRSARSLRWR